MAPSNTEMMIVEVLSKADSKLGSEEDGKAPGRGRAIAEVLNSTRVFVRSSCGEAVVAQA
jgi:hypothetical protein